MSRYVAKFRDVGLIQIALHGVSLAVNLDDDTRGHGRGQRFSLSMWEMISTTRRRIFSRSSSVR